MEHVERGDVARMQAGSLWRRLQPVRVRGRQIVRSTMRKTTTKATKLEEDECYYQLIA